MTELPVSSAEAHTPQAPSSPSPMSIDDWSYSASELDTKVFEPAKMVVPGVLPVGLAVLGGKPKSGKSFLAFQMSIAVAQGTQFLGHGLTQGDALYFAMEDNQERMQARGRELNENDPLPERLRIYKTGAQRIDLIQIEELIEAWADTVSDPTLVVIDTLVRVMPTKPRAIDDYTHNTQVLGALQELALRRGIAVLLIHHESKRAESVDDFDTLLGSTGINGTADTLMLLKTARGSQLGELSITGRDLPERMAIPLEKDGVRWKLSGVRDHRALIDVSPLKLKALMEFAAGASSPGDVREALGISASHTSNLLKELKGKGYVTNEAYGHYQLAPGVGEKLRELDEGSESNEPFAAIHQPPAPDVLAADPMKEVSQEFEF